VAFGVMPQRISRRWLASYYRRRLVAVWLLVVLQGKEPEASGAAAPMSSSIKLGRRSPNRSSSLDLPLFLGHRGGGEEMECRSAAGFCRSAERGKKTAASVFGSSSSTDLRWPHASSTSTTLAEGWLLQDMVAETAWRLFNLNLQADVPLWGPLSSSGAGSHASISPSGAFLGGDAGARC
jgi:hypothetical protein